MARVSLLGMTMDLPEEWRGVQAVFLGPPSASSMIPSMSAQASFRENIAFHIGPSLGSSPKDYLSALLQSMNVTVKQEPQESGGAAKAETVTQAPGGARIRQLFHASVHDGETWCLTFSFLEGGDTKAKRVFFESALATLKTV